MGVVCCEAPAKLAHEDKVKDTRHQGGPSLSSISGNTPTTTSSAPFQSDRPANSSRLQATLKPAPAIDQANDTASIKTIEAKESQDKKSVRISDEVTLIPLLTSASYFRKTPKPITVTSNCYGIMPSFRIVKPTTIASESTKKPDDDFVSKSSLWWTKEERRQILQANHKASRDFKRFQPTKIRQANLVYSEIVNDCCCRHECQHNDVNYDDNDIGDFFQRERLNSRIAADDSTNAASSNSVTASTSHPSTKKRKRSDMDSSITGDSNRLPLPAIPDATIDLPTNVRGLEWGVMPDAKRYRKAHAKTVLLWQDRFRRMNARRRTRHNCDKEDLDSSESSSSSSYDDEVYDGNNKNCEKTCHQQDLLLGRKASISSLRSCILARVFGNSDEIAVNPFIGATAASDLDEKQSSTWSPTPSLTGTESSGSDEDEQDNDDASDSESDTDSDSEDDEHEQRTAKSILGLSKNRVGYYSTANTPKRMFRPRMMPPMSWR